MLIVAWFVTIACRRIAISYGLLRYVWHPALFVFAVYVIVLFLNGFDRGAVKSRCPIPAPN